MRVLIAGMGSAIGTAVARVLERDDSVESILGFDLEPPRRWMRRAEFRFARPGDVDRVTRIVTEFEPTAVVHAWVFEPRARSSPGQARQRTVAGTETLLGAIAQVDTVEHITARSGLSVYGRGANALERPDHRADTRPTSTFGRMLVRVEQRCRESAAVLDAGFGAVRVAPIMASNLPNTLGRYLRLPIVPAPITSKRFGVVHLDDAASAIAASTVKRYEGPINIVADGPVTPLEALKLGRRIPVPMMPVAFRLGRWLAELPGTPLPEHVVELLSRGQAAAAVDLQSELGISLSRTCRETIQDLYADGRLIEVDSTPALERH